MSIWLGRCERCGFVTAKQHDCDGLVATKAEAFRETPPASPLAALKGAVGRLEAVAGDPADVRRCGARPPCERPCYQCASVCHTYDPAPRGPAVVGEPQQPTPAAMLDEAYALLERARVLALNAYDEMPETPLSRTTGVVCFGDARSWVERLRREAEAQNGR